MGFQQEGFEDFNKDGIRNNQELRAELVVALLRMGQFEDALNGALPLVGTRFQPWFLYAKAWHEWSCGRSTEAVCLLRKALSFLGELGNRPLEFLLHEGVPVMFAEFSGAGLSVRYRTTPRRRLTVKDIKSPVEAERIFQLLYFLLPIAITGYPYGANAQPDEEDSWGQLFFCCLEESHCRIEMAQHLLELWKQFPFWVGVSASAVVFLLLVDREKEALQICQRFIAHRPYVSLMRTLHIACLYRSGHRTEAISEGEWLLAGDRRDSSGYGLAFLGLLAAKEGSFEVASRFVREAALRGNEYAFELEAVLTSELR